MSGLAQGHYSDEARLTTWSPARQRFAALAALAAVVTGALAVWTDPSARTFEPGLYVLVAVSALVLPAGIAIQVIAGEALVAGLILRPDGPGALLVLPVVAGVVATAELLAVVARLDTPLPGRTAGAGAQVAWAAAIGGGAFATVALVGRLQGPGGLLAVVLAAGACGYLATRLGLPVRSSGEPARQSNPAVGVAWPLALAAGLASLLAGTAAAQDASAPGDPEIPFWSLGEDAQSVVVLHGGPGLTHDYLLPECGDLASGRRVVLYDQRGCGAGRAAGLGGVEELIADLDRLVRYVSPGRAVVLAGSSWGSYLAAHYVDRHPDRVAALVLSGFPARLVTPSDLTAPRTPILESSGLRAGIDPVAAALARMDSVARRLGSTRLGPGSLTPSREHLEERAALEAELSERFVAECPEASKAIRGSTGNRRPGRELRLSDMPILLFADDLFGRPFEESVRAPRLLQDGRIRVVEGGGHDPWHTHRRLFFATVRAFLEEIPPRDPD